MRDSCVFVWAVRAWERGRFLQAAAAAALLATEEGETAAQWDPEAGGHARSVEAVGQPVASRPLPLFTSLYLSLSLSMVPVTALTLRNHVVSTPGFTAPPPTLQRPGPAPLPTLSPLPTLPLQTVRRSTVTAWRASRSATVLQAAPAVAWAATCWSSSATAGTRSSYRRTGGAWGLLQGNKRTLVCLCGFTTYHVRVVTALVCVCVYVVAESVV